MIMFIFLLIFLTSTGAEFSIKIGCSNLYLNSRAKLDQRIDKKLFEQCSSLKNLSLQHDGIRHINKDAFFHLANVKRINLSYNNITYLPMYLFSDTPKIVDINFSSNNIIILPAKLFNNLPHLKIVNFQSNNIIKVESYSFINLQSLQAINLGDNRLSSLQLNIIDNFDNLKGIYLGENPWNCDTSANYEFCNFMQTVVERWWQEPFVPRCRTPNSTLGLTWKELIDAQVPLIKSNIEDKSIADSVVLRCSICQNVTLSWDFENEQIPKIEPNLGSSLNSKHNNGTIKNITYKANAYSNNFYSCSVITIKDFTSADIGNYTCYVGNTSNYWHNTWSYVPKETVYEYRRQRWINNTISSYSSRNFSIPSFSTRNFSSYFISRYPIPRFSFPKYSNIQNIPSYSTPKISYSSGRTVKKVGGIAGVTALIIGGIAKCCCCRKKKVANDDTATNEERDLMTV